VLSSSYPGHELSYTRSVTFVLSFDIGISGCGIMVVGALLSPELTPTTIMAPLVAAVEIGCLRPHPDTSASGSSPGKLGEDGTEYVPTP
jgi:hypothetical protein